MEELASDEIIAARAKDLEVEVLRAKALPNAAARALVERFRARDKA
jgi:hypothetical protein